MKTGGQVASENFYWLSTQEETLDWSREEEDASGQYDISTWTPTKEFADYTSLNLLPRIDVEVTAKIKNDGDEGSTTVMIHNPTSSLAFAVRLKLNRSSSNRVSREEPEDSEILPVLWQDNYFSLLPGETRQITATYPNHQKENRGAPFVEVEGWNVHRTIAKPQP